MLVRYWQPFREFDMMRRQFDRLFDEMNAIAPAQPAWMPAVELKDEGDNFVLRAQLPGIDAKDLDVQVTREAVLIAGEQRSEQRSENNGIVKSEFRYGNFRRVVPLPVAVINDQVQADYKDGILSLTLPKVVEARNTVVKLNLADTTATESLPAETEASTEATSAGEVANS
ncbi:Hsp20/alpha crystallin family protein [Microcoleus sp. FACHB-1515]|uniref:Hsp20/alpha crystallin family protein n=1 Tax=Cyanophyceae TaxID=3028117 RepID=UPI001689D0FD|nr:Hsp20/alpha crystallin family protein [Microcoleus sp. FACHB-1515]MBD2088883.1 Hsp20/alpha crystallin family protein [Microcoleus sp. FACHB-1515]